MDFDDIRQKRAVLFSARLRFLPETQPVKETAIGRYVEQILLLADGGEGMTLHKIEREAALQMPGGTFRVPQMEIKSTLERLIRAGRVEATNDGAVCKYRLAKHVFDELWRVHAEAEARLDRVVRRIFQNTETPAHICRQAFLEFLCLVFSRLGDAYVSQIRQEITREDLLSFPAITDAIGVIVGRYPGVDEGIFRVAAFTFFRQTDPDYDEIKWNFAQHYYVTKVLGLDPSGYLLSKEVFGEAILYLDTNVLMHALASTARHHGSFVTLCNACQRLSMRLCACQASLDELKRVVDYQREVLPDVIDQIPPALTPKVRGVFYELYREKQLAGEDPRLDELFSAFDHPMEHLASDYGVELVDDMWFIRAETSRDTHLLVDSIKQQYLAKRHRTKSNGSAMHDALVLRWIGEERRLHPWTWFVTLDTSLPGLNIAPEGATQRPLAITLDALLQWLSPLGVAGRDDDEFAVIFGQAISYQLLSSSFFDIRDFHVFAKMDWACKQLPAADVEECIRYLRANASELNPSDAIDREKLARALSRFFADPGREYHREVERLEQEKDQLRTELGSQIEYLNKERQREHEQSKAELDREKAERALSESEISAHVANLQDRLNEFDKQTQERALRRARLRFSLLQIATLACISVAAWIVPAHTFRGVAQAVRLNWLSSWQMRLILQGIFILLWMHCANVTGSRTEAVKGWLPFVLFRRYKRWFFGAVATVSVSVLGTAIYEWFRSAKQ